LLGPFEKQQQLSAVLCALFVALLDAPVVFYMLHVDAKLQLCPVLF
jgi:hypothetical protein